MPWLQVPVPRGLHIRYPTLQDTIPVVECSQIPPQSQVILQLISRHGKLYCPLSGIRLVKSPPPLAQARQEVFLRAWCFNDPLHTNRCQCKFIGLYPKPPDPKLRGWDLRIIHEIFILISTVCQSLGNRKNTDKTPVPMKLAFNILTKPSIQCLCIFKLKNHCVMVLIGRNT